MNTKMLNLFAVILMMGFTFLGVSCSDDSGANAELTQGAPGTHTHDDGTVHADDEHIAQVQTPPPGTHVHEDGTVHADDAHTAETQTPQAIPPGTHTHDDGTVHADDAHTHDAGGKTSQVTFRSDRYEIFLEHPFIVANEPVTFVTHVTDLVTLMPRRAGSVTFVMRQGSQPPIEHIAPAPARDGIYLPELTFPQPGQWTVTLVVPLDHRIELPPFTVFGSDAEVELAPAPDEIMGISFLKEQQWPIPTRIELVQKRKILDREVLAIPESALVDEGGISVAFVQLAGETFEERHLELGVRDNGLVQILSGLAQGDYVVTKGADAISLAESAGPDQQTHVHDDGTVHADDAHATETQATPPGTHTHADGTVHADDEHAADDAQTDAQGRAYHLHGDGSIHYLDEPTESRVSGTVVLMPAEELIQYGIGVGTAAPGRLEIKTSLPGEISFNADKLAHVVPKVPGIVREVIKNMGDKVAAGEIIAWLESPELGRAKVEYLAKLAEVNCCSMDYIRAQEVLENTQKLLEVLKTSPTLETLRSMNSTAMGNYRSQLVSAYAEFTFAQDSYVREKSLYEQKITPEEDYLKAQSAYKKADALYAAALDSVEFEVERNYREIYRERQVQQMGVKSAERSLYVLGLTSEDIEGLEDLAQGQSFLTDIEDCDQPDCPICQANQAALANLDIDIDELRQANEKLAWYPIRAPFDGSVIEKHIALGEVIKDDAEMFLIADLSTVWVNLQVYQKDLPLVRVGQHVCLKDHPCLPETHGVIDYVGPLVGALTRTAAARVVLPNPTGELRPGLFVDAQVTIKTIDANVLVHNDHIQYLSDAPVVFIQVLEGFELRGVTLGQSDGEFVAVTNGLAAGERYATTNSFLLKSEMDSSAGPAMHVHGDGTVHIDG